MKRSTGICKHFRYRYCFSIWRTFHGRYWVNLGFHCFRSVSRYSVSRICFNLFCNAEWFYFYQVLTRVRWV